MDLPDVNVWVAMTVPDHPHYQTARRYWEHEAADLIAFCRVTALGYVRLCTNSAVMRGNPLTLASAWQAYVALRQLPEVTLLGEPDGCEGLLHEWIMAQRFVPRMWTDAYLAAFAHAGGLRLVSFDRDFNRFPEIEFLHLEHR